MNEWKGLAATIVVVGEVEVDPEDLAQIRGRNRTVEEIPGGEDALQRLRKGGIDLVLLNMSVAGAPTLELIAAARRGGDADVVVLAGPDDVEKVVEAMEAGAADYLTKPLDWSQVALTVDRLLDIRRLKIASSIASIVHRLASTTDHEKLPPRVVDAALQATRAQAAAVYLWEEVGLTLLGTSSDEEETAMRGVAGEVLGTGKPAQTVEEDQGPILAWPMIAHDQGIGVLVVRRDPGAEPFDAGDEQHLSIVATEAALSLDRVRLIDSLQSQVDELARARHQLAAAEQLQGVGQLATGYAHELTGPIQVLQSHLRGLEQILQSDEPDLDEAKKALGYALGGASRIQAAVGELSLLGRKKDDAVIDAARLVALARRMTMAGSDAEVQEDVVSVAVEGNVGHLVQALVHLLRNAVRAVRDVAEPTITLRVRSSAGEARFDVIDNGPGLHEFVVDRIFEPFVTTWEGHGGLGLGIARQIAEDAGGDIEVCRHDDGGVIATLTLPALEDDGTLEFGDE